MFLRFNQQPATIGELRWQIISFDRGLDAIPPKNCTLKCWFLTKRKAASQNGQKAAVKIVCLELDDWYFKQLINVLVAARQRGCVIVKFIRVSGSDS